MNSVFAVFLFATVSMALGKECRHHLIDVWDAHIVGPVVDKWIGYAAAYDDNLCKFHDIVDLAILEIGVQSGGSIHLWKKYFSNARKAVGIDINPLCSQVHAPDIGVYIEIGSQNNATFLHEVCEKHGPFHIIIDDGSHFTSDIIICLRTLFPTCLVEGGTYVVEDTCMMGIYDDDAVNVFEGKDLSDHIAHIYRSIHHYWSPHSKNYDPIFSSHVYRLSLFDGMVFIEKKRQDPLERLVRGDWRIPNEPTEIVHFPAGDEYLSYVVDVGENSDIAIKERLRGIYQEMKKLCDQYELHNYMSQENESCAGALTRQVLDRAYRTHWLFDEKILDS